MPKAHPHHLLATLKYPRNSSFSPPRGHSFHQVHFSKLVYKSPQNSKDLHSFTIKTQNNSPKSHSHRIMATLKKSQKFKFLSTLYTFTKFTFQYFSLKHPKTQKIFTAPQSGPKDVTFPPPYGKFDNSLKN